MKKVVIHSDGACDGNPGPGGWAAVLQYGECKREICGSTMATTNNRMEIQAAIEGLRALRESCEVELYTDSEYLRDGITTWIVTWKQKNWKTAARKPVKNVDLWQELDELASKHRITWHWLKGHAGHVHNERCDYLATEEIRKLRLRKKQEDFTQALAVFREQHTPKPVLPPSTAPVLPSSQPSTAEFSFE